MCETFRIKQRTKHNVMPACLHLPGEGRHRIQVSRSRDRYKSNSHATDTFRFFLRVSGELLIVAAAATNQASSPKSNPRTGLFSANTLAASMVTSRCRLAQSTVGASWVID